MPNRKTRLVECEVRDAGAPRTLTFIASTERVGRDGDIIRVDGWDTANFEKNPVFLWSHDPRHPPIGRIMGIRKESKRDDPRLEVDVQFAGWAEESPLAEQIYQLYQAGFLRTVSVGFIPKKRAEMSDDEKREVGLDPWGNVWIEQELLEISAVSVPADPGAVMLTGEVDGLREAVAAVRGAGQTPFDREWDLLEDTLDAAQGERDYEETATDGTGTIPNPLPLPKTRTDVIIRQGPLTILRDEDIDRIAGKVTLEVVSSVRDLLRDESEPTPANPPANEEDEGAERGPYGEWGDLADAIRKSERKSE